jgi:hypothetical protein
MKSKKKKIKEEKKTPVKPKNKQVDAPKSEEFHFGGIPERDLKKNLGCG